MKKISLKGMLVFSLMAILSCGTSTQEKTDLTNTAGNTVKVSEVSCTSVHVPLAEAQYCIHRYDSIWTASFGTNDPPIKAFTIHAADMLEALGIPKSYKDSVLCKYKHARAYIGLDSENKFKLFFTPVNGADLCAQTPNAGTDVILADTVKGVAQPYVMDLNAPCPNTCDPQTPLTNHH